MKVILKQDVKSLGAKDSIVNVSDGYARNYLFPRGLAIEAKDGVVKEIKMKKEAQQNKKDKELEAAQKLAKKLEDIVLVINAKAGSSGKLFGSITSMELSEKFKEKFNLDVNKKKIHMEDHIKSLGEHSVELRLYPGVTASVTVKVVAEKEEN